MLMRLNLETRVLHPEADYPWLELMSLDASRARYLDQLLAVYGYEAPVEAALALTPGIGDAIQLRPRSRSGAIVEDLLALALTPSKIARLPQCKAVVPFRDPSEALGWMYVLERSTLLHETVRSHLASRMPTVSAWNYLSAYHGVASLRWQDFGHTLDTYAVTPSIAEHIITAARAAFECLRDWFASEPARVARSAWEHEEASRVAR